MTVAQILMFSSSGFLIGWCVRGIIDNKCMLPPYKSDLICVCNEVEKQFSTEEHKYFEAIRLHIRNIER